MDLPPALHKTAVLWRRSPLRCAPVLREFGVLRMRQSGQAKCRGAARGAAPMTAAIASCPSATALRSWRVTLCRRTIARCAHGWTVRSCFRDGSPRRRLCTARRRQSGRGVTVTVRDVAGKLLCAAAPVSRKLRRCIRRRKQAGIIPPSRKYCHKQGSKTEPQPDIPAAARSLL